MRRKDSLTLSKFKRKVKMVVQQFKFHLIKYQANKRFKKGDFEQAYYHWKKIYGHINFTKDEYISYLQTIVALKKYDLADKIIKSNDLIYKCNRFNRLALEVAVARVDHESIIKYVEDIDYEQIIESYDLCLAITHLYMELGEVEKAKKLVFELNKKHPHKQEELIDINIKILVDSQRWHMAIALLKEQNENFERDFKLIMLYQIIGEKKESQRRLELFQRSYKNEINVDELGYRKLILFDNGKSRIELYKKLMSNDTIFLTFDSINMVWDNPSFGFRLLKKENVDIIAVRKKEKQVYQQDLSQEEFVEVVKPAVGAYHKKLAYGFSLGAYQTLYFATLLDFRILSLSPRLSIHPVYGRKHIIERFEMKHNLELPENLSISPIVVYDPKNKLDNNYVNNEVMKRYPKAHLIAIPYAGHGIAPYLRDTGQLKSFVFDFINNEVPMFDRSKRTHDIVYFVNLATECLKHKKYNWALDIIERGLLLNNRYLRARQLKVRTLIKLEAYDEALENALEGIKIYRENLDFKIYIVDIYLETGKLKEAEQYLSKLLAEHPNVKGVKARKIKLEKLLSN